jgi:mannitol-1-phosphate/altronate dehydrogenase
LLADNKVSAIGLLVEALAIRKASFTAMSCNNLTHNGKKIYANGWVVKELND